MTRLGALKFLMRAVALVMGVGFGLSHLFFPSAYFRLLGQRAFDGADPMQVCLANLIGVLIIALCVGFWLAASDPVRNRAVVIVFLVTSVLLVPVYFYHLVFTRAIGGWEWLVGLAVAAMALFSGVVQARSHHHAHLDDGRVDADFPCSPASCARLAV